MIPYLGSIYTIPIYSYGVSIAIGFLLFVWLIHRDARVDTIISRDLIDRCILYLFIASFMGGKILWIISEWNTPALYDVPVTTFVTYSGFSILGSVITSLLVAIICIYIHGLPLFAALDIFAQYTPLLHMWGRIGCFFAGCCYGCTTTGWLSVTYTHPEALAPLGIPLHPVQLYAALWHCVTFWILWIYRKQFSPQKGIITALYLLLTGSARFALDVFRADHMHSIAWFSISQLLALIIISISIAILGYARYYVPNH